MLRVALTGGIATGKTYVLDRFRDLGAACLEADELAHGVMAPGTEATRAIAARFGDRILDGEGAVDRRRLAPVVFSDADARRDLEAIVHPAVGRAIEVALRALASTDASSIAIVEIPLLYETGGAGGFKRVIATVCPPALQLSRITARGLSDHEARQRLAAQMPSDEKARRADYVIDTGGSFEETDAQVSEVWKKLI